MSEVRQLPQQTQVRHTAETELEQKLADLKTYQGQFDQANHAMRRVKNQTETLAHWHRLNEAERKYEITLHWLEACGYTIKWNKERQAYEAYKHHMS